MRFFTRSRRPVRKNPTLMPSTNSSAGTVPNRVWPSTEPLSFATSFLEQKNLAPSTINARLAAVRRLAYEAFDTGLLSPDLVAGIRRVKGAKRLGVRLGNWLTVDQSRILLGQPPTDSLRGKRDRAILALLIGCGLRLAELVGLETEDFQVREEHWVIADLIGKGKHIRTVPVPAWAKRAVDEWTTAAGIKDGAIFRRVSRLGKVWGDGITPKAIWHVVKAAAKSAGIQDLAPRGALAHAYATWQAENLSRFNFFLDTHRSRLLSTIMRSGLLCRVPSLSACQSNQSSWVTAHNVS